jgi:hypothetical protein
MRQTLRLHPDSRCVAVTRVEVQVARPRPRSLVLDYTVTGKINDLAMPPAAAPERTDALWRHTCFEAFLRITALRSSAEAGYYEFNFAPSTQWAAFRFDGYRSGMRIATEIGRPQIAVETSPERYILQASLEFDGLPNLAGGGGGDGERAKGERATWHVGLSAVIEDADGRLSYWALTHPPGKADFHHPDCFALELA